MTRGGFAGALFFSSLSPRPFSLRRQPGAQAVPSCTLEWHVVPGDNQPGGSNGIGSLAVVNGHDIWAVGSAVDGDNRNTLIAHWNGTESRTVVDSPNETQRDQLPHTSGRGLDRGACRAVGYSRTPGSRGSARRSSSTGTASSGRWSRARIRSLRETTSSAMSSSGSPSSRTTTSGRSARPTISPTATR